MSFTHSSLNVLGLRENLEEMGEERDPKGRNSYPLPIRKTEVPQLGHVPLTAAFPFLSVTFCGFFISMLALHLTQYACGISVQLRAHWSVVVFETHVERGDTHEG
jgi:hypothetical protein